MLAGFNLQQLIRLRPAVSLWNILLHREDIASVIFNYFLDFGK
jgi:hypothetical protein